MIKIFLFKQMLNQISSKISCEAASFTCRELYINANDNII